MKMLHDFDAWVTKWIQAWPASVKHGMYVATFLGQPPFTVGVGVLAIGLGWGGSNMPLFYAGLIVLVTLAIGAFTKTMLRRQRPLTEYVSHMWFKTYSFPSGHSVGGVVSYGFLAYLALQLGTPAGFIACVLLGFLAVIIGLSRIYLGAHHPTDVLAGWIFGGVGLFVIIYFIQPGL